MSREFRRVPPDWKHPQNEHGRYIPLFEGPFEEALEYWEDNLSNVMRTKGLSTQQAIGYIGKAPLEESYMPTWTKEEATHYQIYENTSEGTPITSVFSSSEELDF